MKIAVISSQVLATPPVGYAGLEILAYHQAKGLAAKGHEVTLIASEGSGAPGCNIIITGPVGQWDEWAGYQRYWKQLPEYDCVIDNSWSKWSYMLKGEGNLKAPILGVCHAPVNGMFNRLPPNVEKPCFVCISKDQASQFEAIYGQPVRVAYNGIDLDFYKPMEGVKRTNRFLFLARFSTIKSPDLCIQACVKEGVGLDLVGDQSLTGEPDYLNKCKQMVEQANKSIPPSQLAEKGIILHGACSRGETVYWYSKAHCMLHPNKLYREPFGLAPVEAQACGLPVIAWRYGAMTETVKEGHTGFHAKSMEELCWMIDKMRDHRADQMRDDCIEWAKKFSIQNMIDKYESLCDEAIKTGGW